MGGLTFGAGLQNICIPHLLIRTFPVASLPYHLTETFLTMETPTLRSSSLGVTGPTHTGVRHRSQTSNAKGK